MKLATRINSYFRAGDKDLDADASFGEFIDRADYNGYQFGLGLNHTF